MAVAAMIKSGCNLWFRPEPAQFGQDVGVEQPRHQNLTSRTGGRWLGTSRPISLQGDACIAATSTAPDTGPADAGIALASARIRSNASRTSASVERPFDRATATSRASSCGWSGKLMVTVRSPFIIMPHMRFAKLALARPQKSSRLRSAGGLATGIAAPTHSTGAFRALRPQDRADRDSSQLQADCELLAGRCRRVGRCPAFATQ